MLHVFVFVFFCETHLESGDSQCQPSTTECW